MVSAQGGRGRRPWGGLLLIGVATLALPAGAALENLALHRPYLCSDEILPGWTGLTDGVENADAPPGCFATGNSNLFPKQVVIDLGAVYQVSKISVVSSKNGNTRHVSLFVSPDANEFEKLREYYFPADAVQTLAHSFTPRRARYVKIELADSWKNGPQGANCLFLREVQVLGEVAGPALEASGREELRLARLQAPLLSTPAVTVFRRYRLASSDTLRLGVLGDSYAAVAQSITTWPEALAAGLETVLGAGKVELINLANPQQTPAEGAELLTALAGERPADLVFVAYGRDAALARTNPVEFRNAWQQLTETILARVPGLVVVVTPAPLLNASGSGAPTVAPLTTAEEEVARAAGLPVVRSGAVLATATDPNACYGEDSALSELGHSLVARAIRRLLLNQD